MMKLEFMEEFSGSSDQMIIKGKRAKRRRPSSSTSSTADFHHSSPTTSSTTTEEDEDMAHCLILLARGYSPPQIKTAAAEAEDKFTTAGKLGIYVYECKTCDRTFPSFQALGGHRASHKRPKTATDDDPPPPEKQSDEEGQFRPSPPVINRIFHNEPNKSSKIHECSICGSEFGSGQALGGHMRRHRATNIANARICDKIDTTTSSHEKPRSMLTFDLNLPAPPEDQFPAKQQPRLVFSAAALVDCHY